MISTRIASAAILVMALTPAQAEPLTAGCGLMQSLAQEHANDMARRERLDHAGFAKRAARGARAENVAFGHASEAETLAQWRASSRHAANMQGDRQRAIAFGADLLGHGDWTVKNRTKISLGIPHRANVFL